MTRSARMRCRIPSAAEDLFSRSSDTAAGVLVYNNVFYRPSTCYFQSHNGGVSAYDSGLFANNICYGFPRIATDIYLANHNSRIAYNDLLAVDGNGDPQPNQATIIW